MGKVFHTERLTTTIKIITIVINRTLNSQTR